MVVLTNSRPMVTTRVLYIGSAVPLDTVAGLEAIQGPLKERYPVDNESNIEGIDANLSVTDSCIQMQYIKDPDSIVQFPISSLTLCAAVRCITTTNSATGEKGCKFVSLNDPLAGGDQSHRPAIFTAITRRTQGRKVLECHGFICSSPRDALNLVKFASIAGKNYKQNGTVKTTTYKPSTVITPRNGTVHATVERDPFLEFSGISSNRMSANSSILATSTLNKTPTEQNGAASSNGAPMRLIPAEPIAHVSAGPEFFEPVSTQGYFYTTDRADVKKYNIEQLHRNDDKENVTIHVNQPAQNGTIPRSSPVVNGYTAAPQPRPASERPTVVRPAPPPIYVRLPPQYSHAPPPPRPRPIFYGPPPPPPPVMYARPRFFSPPPPRFHPAPFMMPPGGPPPMRGAPIFVRRPVPRSDGSRSRSPSTDSQHSRRSRSKTPTQENVNQTEEPSTSRGIPNADESSDESIQRVDQRRPSTPPTDYDDRKKGERMSRRDVYEVRYGIRPPPPPMYGPPPDLISPYGRDYYVYPPRNGGYAPFPMFNPHARAKSLPDHGRQGSKSPKRKTKRNKKSKKNKDKKKKQPTSRYVYSPREGYKRQTVHDKRSDVSTDSYAGYHSEVPLRSSRPAEASNGYQFYPPRDFRRDEQQFMNERHFSKRVAEETRRSNDVMGKPYPTAYELNDALSRERPNEPDFTMY